MNPDDRFFVEIKISGEVFKHISSAYDPFSGFFIFPA